VTQPTVSKHEKINGRDNYERKMLATDAC